MSVAVAQIPAYSYPNCSDKLDARVERALSEIDRRKFVNCEDADLVVGTSIPSKQILRQILNLLELPPYPNILQVGMGIGYTSAVLSRIAKQVVAIEKVASLAQAAQDKMHELNLQNVIVRHGDGNEGSVRDGPFDIIVVSTPSVKDKSSLLNQLAPLGQMVCMETVEGSLLRLVKYTKDRQQHCTRTEHDYIDFARNKGEILLDLGFVTNEILAQARSRAKTNNSLLIDEVRSLTNPDDIELYSALSKRYGIQLGNIDVLLKRIDLKVFDSFSKAFLDHYRIIPLYIEQGSLKIATRNPDVSLAEVEKVFPGLAIEKILVTPTDFRRLWSATDLYLRPHGITSLSPGNGVPANKEDDLLEKWKPEVEARLVSIFEALLLDSVAERASDIHLEQYHNVVRVRLRVDGELHDLPSYNITPGDLKGLINIIKLRSSLNIAERRLPQGGRSSLRVGNTAYDLRVQVQPSLHGEHVVIRLLRQNSELICIERLGLSPLITENYKRLLRNPSGLVLVVGPTGSGKSTTLYAGLQLLAEDGRRKIITVEDPIEYSINNIQQTQVHPEIGFNFADAMRSFVRQDPDVILVGEIRDYETALEAIRASQTGHVVLSTLHCNDTVDAMQRLYDLGVHPNSLASEILAVVAQRLAKRICSHCREQEVAPDSAILRELFPTGTPDSFRSYRGKGCEQCNGTGTHGRIAVVEYLQINPELRNAIYQQIPIGELRKLALDCGLVTMRDSALDHVIQGTIPLSELPRLLPAERMAPEARWQFEKTN